MAAGYQGYQGVSADPLADAVRRKREFADQVKAASLDASPTTGMGALSRIAQALIGKYADKQAASAEQEYSTGRKRVSDALISSMFPDEAGQTEAGLGADAPLDIRPAAAQDRVKAALLGQQVQGMADYTHDPMSAIQFGLGQQQSAKAEQAKAAELAYQRDLDARKLANPKERGPVNVNGHLVAEQPDGSYKEVYSAPPDQQVGRAHGTFIDATTGHQMVIMADGSVHDTGKSAYIPPQITSVGGVNTAINKRTLGVTQLSDIGEVAGNRGAIKSAEAQGTAQGGAAFNLPKIEMQAEQGIGSLNALKQRNLSTRYGAQGKLYAIPGTDGANVQAAISQVRGQAFLTAFNQLRGAGAITEVEGQAATAAMTRLADQNISVGEAEKAIDELITYYNKGIEIARKQATSGPILPSAPRQGATMGELPPGVTPDMVQGALGRMVGGIGGGQPQQTAPQAAPRPGSIPRPAVAELMTDHSPQAMAEFDQVFGAGAAQRVLNGTH